MQNRLSFLSFLLFTFFLSSVAAQAAPPANDTFANAQLISGVNGQVSGTNVEATKEAGEPVHALDRGTGSIWYKYIAPGNGVLKLDTSGSQPDTVIAVYQGNVLNTLVPIAASNNTDSDTFFGVWGTVFVGTKTNGVYYIAVDGSTRNGGNGLGNTKLNFSLLNAAPNDNFADAQGLSSLHTTFTWATSNVGASKEPGEPNHAGNAGGKSVWFKWRNSAAFSRSFSFALETKSTANAIQGINASFAVYTGESVNALTPVVNKNVCPSCTGKFTILAAPNVTYYIAVDGFDNGSGAETGTLTLTYGTTKSSKNPDFDRDGKADITVFRPTTGAWYSLDSVTDDFRAAQWGANGDKPLFNDLDGDTKTDYAVFRPDTGAWYHTRSYTGVYTGFGWGLAADIPMTLNYYSQGSGTSFPTVFRPSTGTWHTYSNSVSFPAIQFGQLGDVPTTADFDGDGTDEIAVFRPSNGTWYIANALTGQFLNAVQFGTNGDKPVGGDYDADGKADIAVFRPSNGTWYLLRSSDGAFQAAQWGISTDKPQPGDFDGDGRADYAVFRPANSTWYIKNSNSAFKAVQFGQNGDVPVSAPLTSLQ